MIVTISLPVIGVTSAHHICSNSMSVERLGIRTNSKVINIYLAFWVSVAAINLVIGTIVIFVTQKDSGEILELRLAITNGFFVSTRYIFVGSLDLMLLFAYYLQSRKLSAKMQKLIAQNLRTESTSSHREDQDKGEFLQAEHRLSHQSDKAD